MKVLFLLFTLFVQAPKPIDVEMVRADLVSKHRVTPEDFIRAAKPAAFRTMYTGNLCFAYLPYTSPLGEPSMRSSDLVVYRFTDNKWTFENILPSWPEMSLIDPAQPVFLADVKICEPNGSCKTYKSVSHYDGRELFMLREYTGFDKTLYYKGINDSGNKDNVKFGVGDKITDAYALTDFRVEERQTSFTLKHKSESISAVTKTAIGKKATVDTFERVIANH